MKTHERVGVALTIGLVAAMGCTQSPAMGQSQPVKKPTVDTAPVTKAEARSVLQRMNTVLWKGLHIPGTTPAPMIAPTSDPITRGEVVRELDYTFEKLRPSFKFTPPKVTFDQKRLTIHSGPDRKKLESLVTWGAVAKIGPVASGASPTLSIKQFGDAVGFFIVRVADLTHLPPSEWTPYLNGGRS